MIRDRIIKINDMITNIKDKNILKDIFYLVQPELQSSGECKYSHNDNGIFFDLKLLSDGTLEKIEKLLNNNTSTDTESITYNVYCSDDEINPCCLKLNNTEKNIMIKKKNT
jgi:hypothetical protein